MAIDAREYLTSLIGRTIETYKESPNTVLASLPRARFVPGSPPAVRRDRS